MGTGYGGNRHHHRLATAAPGRDAAAPDRPGPEPAPGPARRRVLVGLVAVGAGVTAWELGRGGPPATLATGSTGAPSQTGTRSGRSAAPPAEATKWSRRQWW